LKGSRHHEHHLEADGERAFYQACALGFEGLVSKRIRYLGDFAEAGANHLLVQAEPSATIHLHRVLSRIRQLGKKAGAVLDPASPISFVEHVLHLCDIVLVMTVNP
jgi:pentose-5-phosphate-3-epimerase